MTERQYTDSTSLGSARELPVHRPRRLLQRECPERYSDFVSLQVSLDIFQIKFCSANSRSFASVIAGCILGAIVMKVRRLKGFIVAGTCLFTVAFGILYHFRGGDSGSSYGGIVAGEIILGIGALSLPPTTTSVNMD